jgi:hypothetical protein
MAAVDVLNDKIGRSRYEIDGLAAELGSDPAVIFHFVRDQIRYEPYSGVLRGGLGTLICRAGNSLDRSLLLAALLQKTGAGTRIVSGTLSEQAAGRLVGRLFDAVRPEPAASPSLADLLRQVSQAVGAPPDSLQEIARRQEERARQERTQLAAYVDHETTVLSGLLAKAKIDPGVLTPGDRVVAEARDHYWVQYQNADGQWVDLDPAFPDAEPGKTFGAVTTTFAPDAIPEELYHHLRITMTLRVAQVADGKDATVNDRVLIDHELRVAEQQGVGITIANVPDQAPDFARPGTTMARAMAGISTFHTILMIGDQAIPGLSFDLRGQLSGIGVPEDADVKQAGGVGAAAGGLAGGLNGAFGGAPAPATTTRIVGEWVDYTVTSPGAAGQRPIAHGYHRDIVAPVTLASWAARSSEPAAATHLDTNALRPRLLWSAQLLPVTGTPIADYAGYLELHSLAARHQIIDYYMKHATGQPGDEPPAPPSAAMVGSVVLAGAAMQMEDSGHSQGYPAVRSYFARPGLIAYEAATASGVGGLILTRGFDIIAYPPRVVANPEANPADAHAQAAAIHLRYGIRATRLEADLLAMPAVGDAPRRSAANATSVFATAETQGINLLVAQPHGDGLAQIAAISAPDSVKGELAGDIGAGQVLVLPSRSVQLDGRPQIGWWRFDQRSGELIGVMPGERGQSFTEYLGAGIAAGFGEQGCIEAVSKKTGSAEDDTPDHKAAQMVLCALVSVGGFEAALLGGAVGGAGAGIFAIALYIIGGPLPL